MASQLFFEVLDQQVTHAFFRVEVHVVGGFRLADQVVEPVLHCVFCASSQFARDLAPPIAKPLLLLQQLNIFSVAPLAFCLGLTIQVGVEVVVPALSAVLPTTDFLSVV